MATDHTEMLHLENVNKICRICAYVAKTKIRERPPIQVASLEPEEILRYFKVDLNHDLKGKHSIFICHSCEMRVFTLRKRITPSYLAICQSIAQKVEHVWQSYDECPADQVFYKICVNEIAIFMTVQYDTPMISRN